MADIPRGGEAAWPRRPATSRDVARLAGVSQSTVSLVFRGAATGRVSPATQRTVHEAARTLGFRPNADARRLRQGAPPTVLIAVPVITQPFFAQVFTGARCAALDARCRVVLAMQPDLDAVAADVAGQGVDAVLACSLRDGGAPLDPAVPLVVLDAEPPPGSPALRFDLAPAMHGLVDRLHALGHRTVAHLAADIDTATFRERGQAVRAACARHGMALLRRAAPIDLAPAQAVAARLLSPPSGEERPTAVVCDDDLIAAGVYRAAADAGLDIPDALSVTGVDDIELARALSPALTTVALPGEELGREGARLLIEALRRGSPSEPQVRRLDVHLEWRGSVGPPAQ
jgi:DNA-binding LacI/PurR family transcriptional regulator